jgi:urease gamma subunit
MTPEEIVTDLNAQNRDMLYLRNDCNKLTHEEVLALMDAAAMQGFRLGSNVALSMVKGALLVQMARSARS